MEFFAIILPYVIGLLIGAALLLTAIVLGAGLVTMALAEDTKVKYSTHLMRWRVIVQGSAIGFMIMATLLLQIE